jgi:hypothetical protein
LLAWLLFPLHAPLTLLLLDAPFGKFAVDSWGNVGGCVGWVAMEMVAVSSATPANTNELQPVTFILNLPAHISPDAATLAGLYLMHYAHRALISPLVLAPTRAPIHAVVVLAAMVFNYLYVLQRFGSVPCSSVLTTATRRSSRARSVCSPPPAGGRSMRVWGCGGLGSWGIVSVWIVGW